MMVRPANRKNVPAPPRMPRTVRKEMVTAKFAAGHRLMGPGHAPPFRSHHPAPSAALARNSNRLPSADVADRPATLAVFPAGLAIVSGWPGPATMPSSALASTSPSGDLRALPPACTWISRAQDRLRTAVQRNPPVSPHIVDGSRSRPAHRSPRLQIPSHEGCPLSLRSR
jgi:hypothetical protein